MKIEIKKNLVVFRNAWEWPAVRDRIKQDYGVNIFAISWRLKRELGFTVRHHKGLRRNDDVDLVDYKAGTVTPLVPDYEYRYHYEPEVHLDFYNEAQMTWFVLKYLNNSQVDQ